MKILSKAPLSTYCFIERYIAELDLIKSANQVVGSKQSKERRWIPPSEGVVKINVDVALSKNTGKAAAAAIARDDAGVFIGASVLVVEGITDPETMEALACREGLALSSDLLLRKVRLSCDNVNVVRNIRSNNRGPYSHVIQEIQARVGELDSVDFVHEGRTSNFDAHSLARSSIYFEVGRQLWLLLPPQCICNFVPQVNK